MGTCVREYADMSVDNSSPAISYWGYTKLISPPGLVKINDRSRFSSSSEKFCVTFFGIVILLYKNISIASSWCTGSTLVDNSLTIHIMNVMSALYKNTLSDSINFMVNVQIECHA